MQIPDLIKRCGPEIWLGMEVLSCVVQLHPVRDPLGLGTPSCTTQTRTPSPKFQETGRGHQTHGSFSSGILQLLGSSSQTLRDTFSQPPEESYGNMRWREAEGPNGHGQCLWEAGVNCSRAPCGVSNPLGGSISWVIKQKEHDCFRSWMCELGQG